MGTGIDFYEVQEIKNFSFNQLGWVNMFLGNSLEAKTSDANTKIFP